MLIFYICKVLLLNVYLSIYLVWKESINDKSNKNNYDIFFIKSEDNGNTFSKPIFFTFEFFRYHIILKKR